MTYELDPKALEALKKYAFPGNVRELENILERASAMADSNTIQLDDLALPQSQQASRPANLIEQTTEIEAVALEQALIDNKWNQSAAARQLGITLRQLRYRCEKMGLLTKND